MTLSCTTLTCPHPFVNFLCIAATIQVSKHHLEVLLQGV